MDDELGRRDNRERSWSDYHEDRKYVSYQSGEEPDSTWLKQAHQNEIPLSSRAAINLGKMNLEHCRTENQIADIMTKGVQVEVLR